MIEQAKQLTNCDVVVIQGTDDDWNRSIPVEGSGTANFVGGFKEILRLVYKNNPKATVIVISPTLQRFNGGDRTASTPNEINKKLYDYTDGLKEECRQQQIQYLDCMKSYFWGMPDEEAFLFYFADGVHPNKKGHELIEKKLKWV